MTKCNRSGAFELSPFVMLFAPGVSGVCHFKASEGPTRCEVAPDLRFSNFISIGFHDNAICKKSALLVASELSIYDQQSVVCF